MIDIATAEEYMRAANPIPTLDAVDADELAFAVAAVHTRRAALMQAPTEHPTETAPAAPPPRSHRVWAFAAAFVLILAVIGAAAWLLRSGNGPVAEEPAENVDDPEAAPMLPDPEALTWTKTDFTLEELGASLRGLTFDSERGFWLWHGEGLWESEDGLSWRFVDVPTEYGDYTVGNLAPYGETGASPGFGLASSGRGPHALLSWQEDAWVEIGQLEMPDTVGIEWSLELAAPIESGGVLVAQGGLTGSLPWGDIYGRFRKPGCEVCDPKPPRQRWDSATQTLHIVDRFDGSILASLAIEVVGDTATFRDAATGAVVHEVVGSADYPIESLMRTARSGRNRINVDGTWVGVPGADLEFHDPGPGRILAAPDGSGFVAYEHGNNGRRTLMSADAVTWSEGTAPPFAHAHPWGVDISSRGGEIVAVVRSVFDAQDVDTQFWVSPDGVTWTQKALPATYDDYEFAFGPYPTEFGYVAWPLEGGLRYWLSVDGESWTEAAGPTAQHGRSSTVAGSALFWADEVDDLGDALWVGHFQP